STTSVPPPAAGVAIHPNGNNAKCMDVRGGSVANGTPVQIYDCNGTNAQKWTIQKGQTKVRLAGTNFCLDAGGNPGNGVGMKIWTCYDNLAAQEWFYTGDNRIALLNKGSCLDLTDGRLSNANQLQTWKCTDFNTNQIWT
ncbi:carbohydrate-binding module family 13 protein, partial [Pleurotus ostreatus PC15]